MKDRIQLATFFYFYLFILLVIWVQQWHWERECITGSCVGMSKGMMPTVRAGGSPNNLQHLNDSVYSLKFAEVLSYTELDMCTSLTADSFDAHVWTDFPKLSKFWSIFLSCSHLQVKFLKCHLSDLLVFLLDIIKITCQLVGAISVLHLLQIPDWYLLKII
jgi:hypothetical protein